VVALAPPPQLPYPLFPPGTYLTLPPLQTVTPFTLQFPITYPATPPNSIRTILSTKGGGCTATPDRNGIAIYVNSWDTSDHAIVFEYGDATSGCNKITSAFPLTITATPQTVTVSYTGTLVLVFIDGLEVGRGVTATVTTGGPVAIGGNGDGEDTFTGGIGGVSAYTYGVPSVSELSTPPVLALVFATAVKDGDAVGEGKWHIPKVSKFNVQGGGRYDEYKDGSKGVEITAEIRTASDEKARGRREEIRESMRFVWKGYKVSRGGGARRCE